MCVGAADNPLTAHTSTVMCRSYDPFSSGSAACNKNHLIIAVVVSGKHNLRRTTCTFVFHGAVILNQVELVVSCLIVSVSQVVVEEFWLVFSKKKDAFGHSHIYFTVPPVHF